MTVSGVQHLKNNEVPAWVIDRFRQYVDSVGGKRAFCEKYKISDGYMSMLWNGKRHPPLGFHSVLHIRLVAQPLVYEDVSEEG